MARLSPSQIASAAAEAGFPAAAIPTVVAIAMAESGGNTEAYNGEGLDRSWGLMQINVHPQANPAMATRYDLTDPVQNMQAALEISGGGVNFKPWTTYTGGAYRQYLGSEGGTQVTNQSAPAGVGSDPFASGSGSAGLTPVTGRPGYFYGVNGETGEWGIWKLDPSGNHFVRVGTAELNSVGVDPMEIEKINESKRQFDATNSLNVARLGQDASQFAQSLGVQLARLGLDASQIAQRAAEFEQTLGLNREQFFEGVRQFDAKLAEDARQFDTGLNFRREEQAANIAAQLQLKQMDIAQDERTLQFQKAQALVADARGRRQDAIALGGLVEQTEARLMSNRIQLAQLTQQAQQFQIQERNQVARDIAEFNKAPGDESAMDAYLMAQGQDNISQAIAGGKSAITPQSLSALEMLLQQRDRLSQPIDLGVAEPQRSSDFQNILNSILGSLNAPPPNFDQPTAGVPSVGTGTTTGASGGSSVPFRDMINGPSVTNPENGITANWRFNPETGQWEYDLEGLPNSDPFNPQAFQAGQAADPRFGPGAGSDFLGRSTNGPAGGWQPAPYVDPEEERQRQHTDVANQIAALQAELYSGQMTTPERIAQLQQQIGNAQAQATELSVLGGANVGFAPGVTSPWIEQQKEAVARAQAIMGGGSLQSSTGATAEQLAAAGYGSMGTAPTEPMPSGTFEQAINTPPPSAPASENVWNGVVGFGEKGGDLDTDFGDADYVVVGEEGPELIDPDTGRIYPLTEKEEKLALKMKNVRGAQTGGTIWRFDPQGTGYGSFNEYAARNPGATTTRQPAQPTSTIGISDTWMNGPDPSLTQRAADFQQNAFQTALARSPWANPQNMAPTPAMVARPGMSPYVQRSAAGLAASGTGFDVNEFLREVMNLTPVGMREGSFARRGR